MPAQVCLFPAGEAEQAGLPEPVPFWCVLRFCETEGARMSQHCVDRGVHCAAPPSKDRQLHSHLLSVSLCLAKPVDVLGKPRQEGFHRHPPFLLDSLCLPESDRLNRAVPVPPRCAVEKASCWAHQVSHPQPSWGPHLGRTERPISFMTTLRICCLLPPSSGAFQPRSGQPS